MTTSLVPTESDAWGYENMLRAIADPADPEHADYIDRYGGSFDPNAFDLDEADAMMRARRAMM
jgi:hypothetical protein